MHEMVINQQLYPQSPDMIPDGQTYHMHETFSNRDNYYQEDIVSNGQHN
jgi:hypothetical protein